MCFCVSLLDWRDSIVDEICERVTSQVLCCLLQVSQMWVTSEHWVERVCCVEDEAAATTHLPVGSGQAGNACTWRMWSESIHVRNNLLVHTKNEFAAAMVDGGSPMLVAFSDASRRRTGDREPHVGISCDPGEMIYGLPSNL